ncbi:DUF3574 domain-containing protein [Celerinatantimonas diazotrophica]|uniref:Uncharacterized protein DUF3574 n=1 Tax=Celerinatantimonas diazotrophica TaxID=412034 RepID=A0A4R1J9Z8_9GAMM|nr:DUF3574 domain-containing protein [Celerinatantimonas diazotrophica]TCK47442.1 uncharacterized protein DUF3574 [Celerinatantimonas diazotrophica]CAG9294939.1 hypothetical protein CEDIAZO_00045 [Celerinatantimonas diazotrophica]
MKLLVSRSLKIGFLCLSLITLAGCAQHSTSHHQAQSVCEQGDLMSQTTLYFGMSRADGPNITQAQWQHFVNSEVTPRFRDGLTVFRGQGQWLGANGKIAREHSRALVLIYPRRDKASNAKIEKLRQLYMHQFQQESVMRVDSTPCVSF